MYITDEELDNLENLIQRRCELNEALQYQKKNSILYNVMFAIADFSNKAKELFTSSKSSYEIKKVKAKGNINAFNDLIKERNNTNNIDNNIITDTVNNTVLNSNNSNSNLTFLECKETCSKEVNSHINNVNNCINSNNTNNNLFNSEDKETNYKKILQKISFCNLLKYSYFIIINGQESIYVIKDKDIFQKNIINHIDDLSFTHIILFDAKNNTENIIYQNEDKNIITLIIPCFKKEKGFFKKDKRTIKEKIIDTNLFEDIYFED